MTTSTSVTNHATEVEIECSALKGDASLFFDTEVEGASVVTHVKFGGSGGSFNKKCPFTKGDGYQTHSLNESFSGILSITGTIVYSDSRVFLTNGGIQWDDNFSLVLPSIIIAVV